MDQQVLYVALRRAAEEAGAFISGAADDLLNEAANAMSDDPRSGN